MSMDLTNQNASQMSMGQIQQAEAAIQGAISDGAAAMTAGKAPSFSGGGDSFTSDVMGSSFMRGGAGQAGQIAMAVNDHMGPGQTAQSSFFTPGSKRKGRELRDDVFGHRMSYGEVKKLAKTEAREMSYIARTGRAPKARGHDDVLRKSEGVFEGAQISGMSIGPGGYMPKAMKFTPEMMINLKLVPAAIKHNLDSLQERKAKPGTEQIVEGFKNNEESGNDLFAKASQSVQEDVAKIVKEAPKPKAPDAPKPAGSMSGESGGGYLH